jgi:hypothetical protein
VENPDVAQLTSPFTIVQASPTDIPIVLSMIRELAEYERLAHEVRATETLLHDALFRSCAGVSRCRGPRT